MKEYKRLTDSETAVMLKNTEGSSWDSEDIEAQRYIRLAELEDKIENGTLKEEKACVWEEWEDDLLGSVWCCSNCKEDFCFSEGGVNENNYGYCPHCGAKIVALKELKGEV